MLLRLRWLNLKYPAPRIGARIWINDSGEFASPWLERRTFHQSHRSGVVTSVHRYGRRGLVIYADERPTVASTVNVESTISERIVRPNI
jgi:hypothetical protein